MRIGIDVRHLAHGCPATGVAAVTRERVSALARVSPNDAFRVFYLGRSAPPDFVSGWPKAHANVSLTSFHGSNRVFDARALAGVTRKADAMLGGVDVFFSPHALPLPLSRAPRVLVIHDLSFVSHPEWFSPQSRLWHASMRMRTQVEQAACLIVPSRATARDLIRFWKIPEQKIQVIPWGVPSVVRVGQRPVRVGPRYILYIGTVEKRKNVLGLLRAFKILKEDAVFADARLVIAGAMGWGSGEIANSKRQIANSSDIEFRGYVTEAEKAALLAQASVFVYPSFYEGFGLPVLEAMTAGVPVVTSRLTSLPEVVGDAALLVDPQKPEEIAAAIGEILNDAGLAEDLSRRGGERASQFTWDSSARQVLAVLGGVAQNAA